MVDGGWLDLVSSPETAAMGGKCDSLYFYGAGLNHFSSLLPNIIFYILRTLI